MKVVLETGLLFKRKMLEMIRQPVWVFMGLTTPLLYVLLFSPLLKKLDEPLGTGQILNTFVPGVLTLLAFIGGTGAGYGVINELQSGVIERLQVSPSSRLSLLLGSVFKDITAFLVPSILVIFIAQFFGFAVHVGGLVIMFVLLSLLTAIVSAWSASLGLILKHPGSMAALVAGLELPLTLLSGVLLPISLGPTWLQVIAHMNPIYYAVEASRTLAAGTTGAPEVLNAFFIIIPLLIITLLWAARVYRKVML